MKRCPACGANLLDQTADCPVCALPAGSPAHAALFGRSETARWRTEAAHWLAPYSAPRFSLGSLLAATTVAGFLLGLVKVVGPWGLALAFFAAMYSTYGRYEFFAEPVSLRNEVWVWGLLMPLACLLFDPYLCKEDSFSMGLLLPEAPPGLRLHSHAPAVYAVAGWHLSGLLYLALVRPRAGWLAALASGHLAAALCWLVIAIVLVTPLVLCGIWMCGITAAGLTPLFAFRACDRLRLTYWVLSRTPHSDGRRFAWQAAGFGSGIAGPVLASVLLYAFLARAAPGLIVS